MCVMKFISKCICFLIKIYQVCVSPILISRCRFFPTCSEYAKEAFREQNLLIAIFVTSKRLFRCQPLSSGGFDPVKNNKIIIKFYK